MIRQMHFSLKSFNFPSFQQITELRGTTYDPVGLVQSRYHYKPIEYELFSPWNSWYIAHLVLNHDHSLTLMLENKWKVEIENVTWILTPQVTGQC